MIKYPKIKRIGHESNDGILDADTISVQEKLDGANFRFTLARNIDGGLPAATKPTDIIFGSRNVVYKNDKDIAGAFRHAVEYVRSEVDREALDELDQQYGPLTFFGEAMHSHTLDYNWDEIPDFLGFDIHVGEEYVTGPEWFGYGDMEWGFEEIGLPTAPRLYVGPPSDFDTEEMPESEYRDGLAEGYTVKTHLNQQMAKVRSEQFKEMHAGSSGGQPSDDYTPSDAKALALKFATEARILKQIHKYKDRGRTIEMGMMEDLWRDVFDDIIEEEYTTIFLGNHTLDTQEFRSEVAGKTAEVLQQYLSRPEDSVLNEAPA